LHGICAAFYVDHEGMKGFHKVVMYSELIKDSDQLIEQINKQRKCLFAWHVL